MKAKIVTLSLLVLIYSVPSFGQIPFNEFSEKFSTNSKPYGWENILVSGSTNWQFKDGSIDNTHPPFNAYEGNYNAVFLYANNATTKTKLVTPEINFDFAIKPVLTFYMAQYLYIDDFGSGNTRLSLYFRSPEYNSNAWTFIKDFQDPIDTWQKQEILLPDTLKYFSSVQLAFEGWSSKIFEHGTCIDDIQIIETGIIPKYLGSIAAFQPSTDVIPTGAKNNPILRLKISVKGNDGVLALDSIGINGLYDSESVVDENGVKLFATTSERFNDTTQVGIASSFENGVAVFNNISYDLPIGNSYLWVTYDVPADNNHEFKGKKLDASISANGIKINNEYYASYDLNPGGEDGYRLIDESLFFDDFEGPHFWNLTGEFEISEAIGMGGFRPEPDPSYARSGKRVLGTDLTGLGSYPGDYERNLGSKAYIAEADTILNAKYFKDLKLGYYRWLNLYTQDSASIEISLNNGETWSPIWQNNGAHIESNWSFQYDDLSNLMDRQEQVLFRFTLGPTDISPYSGWNIDNFAITGTFVNDDAGFLSLVSPTEGCGHFAPEPLHVSIKNYGYSPTNDTVEIGYSLNGGATWIMDTIFEVIPKDGNVDFSFSELIDISAPGYHQIMVKTFYKGDEDNRNDLMDTTIFSSPTYTMPYAENFETNDGFWRVRSESTTWQYGKPIGTIINNAYSGTKAWATNLSGVYPNNDTSILESPCFDFTGIVKPIFECMLFAQGELNTDGLSLQYSINNGASWATVPMHAGPYVWNWYNNAAISALGTAGWDSVETQWFRTRELLPAQIAGESSVKFRFLFASNDTIQHEGFAIDNIRLYEAPADAGITALVSPQTACYLSNQEAITVSIKNFGIRPITASDTLFAKAIINNQTTLIDTFITPSPIAINATQNFTFTKTHNMFSKKWYHFKLYTEVKDDNAFYFEGVYNDTIMDSVYVEGEPVYSLGPDIGTFRSDTISLYGGLQAGNGNPFVHYTWKYHQEDSTGSDSIYFDPPFFPVSADYLDFSVMVENDSGCFAYDTIQVIKSETDIGISAYSGISDACIDNQNPALQVTVKNFNADYTILKDTIITVGYTIDDANYYTESFALLADLGPDETVDYTFTGIQPEFSESGTYNFKIFTVYNGDLKYSNDTLQNNYTIWDLPTVDIGIDTIFTLTADTITLDAGAGFASYLWQDNLSATQTFDIPTNTSDFYSVKVESQFGCGFAYDTLNVVSDNWVLDSIISPISSCAGNETQQVSVHIKNNSPNAYNAGTAINAVMNFDNKTVSRIITTPELISNDSFDYTFDTVLTMTAAKEYPISVKIFPVYDLNKTDNEVSKTVEVWGIYPLDLGYDSIITRRADTITFNAGPHYDTYLWQDNSTKQTFKIPVKNSAIYAVTVTDVNGCSDTNDAVKIIASDIGVTEIVTPESQCNLTGVEKIKLTIFNYGPDVLPASEEISFFYKINDGPWVEKIHTMSVSLAPEASTSIVLFETIPFESNESYQMKLYSRWEKDYFYSNDTAEKTIYQFNKPSVSLGDDIYTTMPDTVILNAGSGHTTYTWKDGSHNQTFAVSELSTSENWVTVTNSNGCSDADTVKIITYDIGIASIKNLNVCEVSDQNTVTINIEMLSQDTLFAGEELTVQYTFNETTVTEQATLLSNLTNNATVLYTFTTPFAVPDTGNYSITASVSMTDEVNTSNNGAAANFRVGPYLVTLPDDIITYESSVVLDAGSGFSAYAWSNGASTQSTEVTEPGSYSVTITDVNGCESSDTIAILFLNPAYDLVSTTGLADSCTRATSQTLSVLLKNNGNDTIYTDSIITLQYKINGGTAIQEPYQFTADFEPTNELLIPFTTPLNLMNTGSYTVTAFVTIGSRTSSIDTVVQTFGLPEINLPTDTSTYANALLLDAGSGFESYLWSTGTSTQTIEVSNDGSYTVTVTNANTCSNSATIEVLFIKPQYNITEILGLADGCENTSSESLSFVLRNDGNDLIYADSTLNIVYQINENNPVAEPYTFAANLEPEQEITISFATPVNLSQVGSYVIQVWIPFGTSTSAQDTTVNTWGYPEVNLGADIESIADSELLDAGEGFATYLWSTGANSRTIEVSNSGSYWVEVGNTHGCTDRDTISILFHPIKLEIFQFTSPLLGCGSLNDEVKMVVKNTGLKEVAPNTVISLAYQFGNEERVNETTQFANAMQPNANLSWTFDELLEEETPGTYTIKLFVGLEDKDLDTAEYTITIFEAPVFFDGQDTIEVAAYPYELNPNVTASTYKWSTDATSTTITVSEDGKYTLTITQDNTCTFEASVVVEKITGIADAWGEQIKVYPVPVEKELRIKIPEHYGAVSIQLHDINGKLLHHNKNARLDELISFENWEQGVYLLRISNSEKTISYQLIKQ